MIQKVCGDQQLSEFVTRRFKTFGDPTRQRGMSLELRRLQSLAHASGFQISRKRIFETASKRIDIVRETSFSTIKQN